MDCIKLSFQGGGGDLCDVPWAAKNYACSFCRREFRSAQALGGHMNVHRRDRARLRLQLPSTLSSETCLETLDNPNPSSFLTSSSSHLSSSAKSCLPYNYSSRHPLVSPSRDEKKKPKFDHGNLFPKKGMRGVGYINEEILKGFAQKDLDEKFNKADMKKDIQLDMELELDLHLELGFFKEDKEEVDLELRLGHL